MGSMIGEEKYKFGIGRGRFMERLIKYNITCVGKLTLLIYQSLVPLGDTIKFVTKGEK